MKKKIDSEKEKSNEDLNIEPMAHVYFDHFKGTIDFCPNKQKIKELLVPMVQEILKEQLENKENEFNDKVHQLIFEELNRCLRISQ